MAAQAEEFTATLNKTVITLAAKAGEGDRLFGSITAADVADAIKAARGITIDKRKVLLEEPIKELGTFRSTSRSPRASSPPSRPSSRPPDGKARLSTHHREAPGEARGAPLPGLLLVRGLPHTTAADRSADRAAGSLTRWG